MIIITKETFSREVFDEILPLAQKCWNESTEYKAESCAYYGERDFQIEPDFDSYKRFADNGWLVLVTIRDEADLRGYVVGLLYQSMHHRKILGALGDSAYVEPEYRSYTAVMVEKFENELASLGVAIIGWPVHVNGPVYPLLKSSGYSGDDIVMEKRLCV
jgi:hypothetical protein